MASGLANLLRSCLTDEVDLEGKLERYVGGTIRDRYAQLTMTSGTLPKSSSGNTFFRPLETRACRSLVSYQLEREPSSAMPSSTWFAKTIRHSMIC